MEDRYVVEVRSTANIDKQKTAARLAAEFKVDTGKVEGLLERLPDVVTKPVSENEANAVAKRFRKAGLEAVVRPAGGKAPPPVPATEPSASERSEDATAMPETEGPADDGAAAADPPTPPARSEASAAPVQVERKALARDDAEAPVRSRRGRLRFKLLAVATVPAILVLAGALAAAWLTARPAVYDTLVASARNAAVAAAASLSSTLGQAADDGAIDQLALEQAVQMTEAGLQRQGIGLLVATDEGGETLSAWFAEGDGLSAETPNLLEAVREEALSAIARAAEAPASGQDRQASTALRFDTDRRVDLVAEPLLGVAEPFGAIVVGVTDRAAIAQVQNVIVNIVLFSLIPLALAIAFAWSRAGSLARNVLYLTDRADRISRGDLETDVQLTTGDELEDLSGALERLRVSMKEALDRLRRRRL